MDFVAVGTVSGLMFWLDILDASWTIKLKNKDKTPDQISQFAIPISVVRGREVSLA